MIDIIPEGKVQISANASMKDRINGIDFTSQGVEVWATKLIDEKDEERLDKMLDEQIDRLVVRYYERLAKEITRTRNELVDKLRIELANEYEVKLKKAKEMIVDLQNQIKLLNK